MYVCMYVRTYVCMSEILTNTHPTGNDACRKSFRDVDLRQITVVKVIGLHIIN